MHGEGDISIGGVITVGSIAGAGNGIDMSRCRVATLLLPLGQRVHGRETEISLHHEGTH